MKKLLNREICTTSVQSSSNLILPRCRMLLSATPSKENLSKNVTPQSKNVTPLSSHASSKQFKESITTTLTPLPKKYSILSVPKSPSRSLLITKESCRTPHLAKLDLSDSYSNATNFTSTRNNLTSAVSEKNNFQVQCKRIRSNYRFKKNPNEENLKIALTNIEKITPRTVLCENNTEKKLNPIPKSEIEVLLESQAIYPRLKKKNKKTTSKRKTNSQGGYIVTEIKESDEGEFKNGLEKEDDVASQRSDPSPVRKKSKASIERSETPQRNNKRLSRVASSKLKFFVGSKIGKEFMEKYNNHKEVFKFVNDESYVQNKEISLTKELYDYKQESLKILKDTSFFANKIMKGIRCPARIKKCYFN